MDAPNQDWCFPVFVVDGADVIVVHDTADVRRKLEPFLASEPVELFDAAGQRMQLSADGGRMVLSVRADDVADDLTRILEAFLVSTGRPVPTESDPRAFAIAVAEVIDPKA